MQSAPLQEPLPSIAIAICSLDRHAILLRTLEALREIDLSPVRRIIVVDQTNPPLAAGRWQEDFPVSLDFIALSRKGLCVARNEAIRRCTEDVILFLDDDVVPDHDLAIRHASAYLKHPGALGVAGFEDTPVTEKRASWGRFVRYLVTLAHLPHFRRSPRYLHYLDSNDRPVSVITGAGLFFCDFKSPEPCRVMTPRGCNMSFRRDVLRAVGGFDEGFVGVARRDESDLALRAIAAFPGGFVYYEPLAKVLHLQSVVGGSGFRGTRSAGWYSQLFQCELLFARKHLPLHGRILTRARLALLHMRAVIRYPSLLVQLFSSEVLFVRP